MKEQTDSELLQEYAEEHSELAFGNLVRRYAPLVYSAALRMVRDSHLAEDVTQRVFLALARNTRKLRARAVLAGWLHTTARNIAVETVRNDARRRAREEDAARMHETTTPDGEASWEQVADKLDDLLSNLSEGDKDVLLLRFFENHDLRGIGDFLGITEDAAQKRVSRALERLRGLFEARGIKISAAVLGAMVAANAVKAAPAGLIPALCISSTLCGAAPAASAISQILTMTSTSKSLVVAIALVAGGAGLYEVHRVGQFQDQLRALRAQEQQLRAELQRLTRERDEAKRERAFLETNDDPARTSAELLRLRSEVTALRQLDRERADAQSTTGSWEARIQQLKRRLDQMPAQRIPEMAFLSDKDWAATTRDANLATEVGVRKALCDLRSAAKHNFLEALKSAIRDYVAQESGVTAPEDSKQFSELVNANPSFFPRELSELQPHLTVAVEDSLFDRYQFTRPATLNEWLTDILVKEVASPADDEYDTQHQMGLNCGSVGPVNRVANSVKKAAEHYAEAHEGRMPDSLEQVAPFLPEPLSPDIVTKYLDQIDPTKQTTTGQARSPQN